MTSRAPRGIAFVLLLASACGGGARAGERAALGAFGAFQDALLRGDAAAVRRLVTEDSRPVVDAMPWQQVRARQPLAATAAHDACGCWHVDVRDPNEHGAPGTFVVVRENGRLVVDLVASAAFAARDTGVPAPAVSPRALTPADHDRIRRYELTR